MALKKEIESNNGVLLNYHRIVSLNKITNISNNIEISSYTTQEKREEEKETLEIGLQNGEAIPTNIYIDTNYIQVPYDEAMTIEEAYDYLKTTEKYEGAEDI